jgi:hypothetical protein
MKKEKNSVNEVKKIISEMFAFGKNVNFLGSTPDYVEFEIDVNDYKLSYDEDLFMEYSEGVMKKRTHQVALKFYSKSVEGTIERPVYKIMFKIKLKPVSEIKFSNDDDMLLCWSFEEKPIDVVRFIKKRSHCDWDEFTGRLTIKKSNFDNLDTEYLKLLINEDGGEKIRI